MGVEGADRDRDAGLQAEPLGPIGREMTGDDLGGDVFAGELVADAVEERVDLGQEILRGQAAPARVPHPFMAHGADAALETARIGDAGERRCHHVAMLQRRHQPVAFFRVVTQPVQKLGEAPFMRIDAAAPLDGLKPFLVGEPGDLLGLGFRTVIAPQVIFVERFQAFADHHHA